MRYGRLRLQPDQSTQLIGLIVCLLLGGCANNDMSDLKHYISIVKARPKGVIEKLPEITMVEPFLFQPDELRDPFRPLEQPEQTENTETTTGNGLKPDFDRRKEELEAFPLDGLKMVGTVDMKSTLWALVKASDNTVHRVHVGNYMGM